MPYDRRRHQRRSIRLKNYDYATPGAYFLTICIHGGECLLGGVWDGEMELSWRGHIVAGAWLWLADRFPYVELDEWQIMPNHLHGIIVLTDVTAAPDANAGTPQDVGAVREPPGSSANQVMIPKPVGRLVGVFKTICTAQINRMQDKQGARLWQRDFYDRVIRNEPELDAIRNYIHNNPAAWDDDQLHPAAAPNRFNQHWRNA